ncbi:hypothetical protein FKV75_09635 [Weissella paramesenteroides]|uniref:hypothetical protein n=1 Tax=Weissella paramesenteroides TaxID=1249 RepID=UPI001238C9BF|nr:hypothetical protein [Weissella paramesenteroides]KAA8439895.1 hypothetical protein FKV75_09635 [Weissella paramesenteroides]KAA8441348.1 hypothetical protein FKV81_03230 [Weissella paramesenteroides]KAA8444090.1 hypothetical protein FKV77_01335 [Weissella paramesenteroides]KAA8448704.1 hypothetical protein FKV76_01280 [Weissella paramesenteroides]KAA8450814.1 hypothetical protein FKV74_03620 [Weissella paramesenteroides]
MTAINTDYTDMTLTISLGDGQIGLTNKVPEPSINAVTLYFKNEQLISIDQVPGDETVTRVAIITPPTNIETNTIALYIDELAAEAKLKLESSMTGQLTDDQRQSATAYWHEVVPLFALLGITVAKKKRKPTKAQHRFKSAMADVPFNTDFIGTKATIYWQKRHEMRLVAGAKMLADAPLKADGGLGVDARFAKQIRAEHADAFDPETFITTKDIVLKSVNEIGLFLYFGGTNSWLVFKGPDDRTIHDWTVM